MFYAIRAVVMSRLHHPPPASLTPCMSKPPYSLDGENRPCTNVRARMRRWTSLPRFACTLYLAASSRERRSDTACTVVLIKSTVVSAVSSGPNLHGIRCTTGKRLHSPPICQAAAPKLSAAATIRLGSVVRPSCRTSNCLCLVFNAQHVRLVPTGAFLTIALARARGSSHHR